MIGRHPPAMSGLSDRPLAGRDAPYRLVAQPTTAYERRLARGLLPGSASGGPSASIRLEDLVHDLCPGRNYRPQLAPVDHLGSPRAGVPSQPRDLLHRHALVTHHADERDPCRRSVLLNVAECLLDGRNRTLWYVRCSSASLDDGSPLGSHDTIGNGCLPTSGSVASDCPDDRHGGGMATTCVLIVAGWTELEAGPCRPSATAWSASCTAATPPHHLPPGLSAPNPKSPRPLDNWQPRDI